MGILVQGTYRSGADTSGELLFARCSLACRSILSSPSFLFSFLLRLFISSLLSLEIFLSHSAFRGFEVPLSLSTAFSLLNSSISLDFKALKQVSKSRPQKNSSTPPPFHIPDAARDRRGSPGCKSTRFETWHPPTFRQDLFLRSKRPR